MRLKLTVLLIVLLAMFTTAAAEAPRDVPDNDDIGDAQAIQIGKSYTIYDVGAATNQFGEENASCNSNSPLFNSVWFTFTAAAYGRVHFSTDGSVQHILNNSSLNTAVAVYLQAGPTVLNESACVFESQADGSFPVAPGGVYFIAVGTDADLDYLPHSVLKFKTRMLEYQFEPDNAGFESALSSGDWKLKEKGGSGQNGIVCNDLIYEAADESCAFRVIAAENNTIKLKQTSAFPKTFVARKGALLQTTSSVKVMDTGTVNVVKVKVTLTYSDGTPPSKAVYDLDGLGGSLAYTAVMLPIELRSSKPANITYELLYKNNDGAFMFDAVSYVYLANPATRDGVLPPP